MGDRRKSLMSHEITRARLRLLTPISEEAKSPRANIKSKNMVAITNKLDLQKMGEDGGNQLEILKQLQELQAGNPGQMTADPNDLKSLVEGYLNDPRQFQGQRFHFHSHGDRARQPRLLAHRPHPCACCEHINRENRGRRVDLYPERYGYWTEDPPPIEMIPYGSPGRVEPQTGPPLGQYSAELVPVRGQLPALQNPGADPVVPDAPRIQVLYPNYEGNRPMNWDSNSAGRYNSNLFPTQPGVGMGGPDGIGPDGREIGGTALNLYPYLPRNMHHYDGNDYDMYRLYSDPGNYSDYERHLMEDILSAARRYDNSMHRLEGNIDHLSPRKEQSVTYKGRFDDR